MNNHSIDPSSLADSRYSSERQDPQPAQANWTVPESPLRLRTKFAFALVTGLGGMVIGTGAETGFLATIVVSFAVIGFLCVDWQKLFSLPPLVAYAAMAFTAIICVADFVQEAEQLDRKMVAVAQLLAVAQAILMLQEKSQRLFEQLLIFSLLNCVVAAVFNDAFSYAIWFLPMVFANGLAMAFLAADQTVETTKNSGSHGIARFMQWDNSAAMDSLTSVSLRIPWVGLFVLIPAVASFAITFFFALPRRVEAKHGGPTAALVGFNEHVELGQIGRMQLNQERAMRVKLTGSITQRPYPTIEGIYLRGRTLERYVNHDSMSRRAGTWETMMGPLQGPIKAIPSPFNPSRADDLNFFDRVDVEVNLYSMRSPAVFAITPYHYIPGSENLDNVPMQGILRRRDTSPNASASRYPRINYRFGTHGFHNGVQTSWFAEPILYASQDATGTEASELQMTAIELDYLDQLIEYPEQRIPSAKKIARKIIEGMPPNRRKPVEIARRFEQYFSLGGEYQYTLDLTDEPIAGMDPIEQFLSVDQRGHCQYYASALAMMLRSEGIPARLVVGYHCDEFSDLGQNYTVRQSHAHAWVEALIDRDVIPIGENIYGQRKAARYWMRLDPTPSSSSLASDRQPGVEQIADLAKNFWMDQVVEMNQDSQNSFLSRTPGLMPMTQSYQTSIESLKALAIRINSGQVSGMGGGRLFSLQAASLAVGLCLAMAIAFKLKVPARFKRRWVVRHDQAPQPTIAFYAETLELLERVGYRRSTGQTPVELSESVSDSTLRDPVNNLTQWFYADRYGKTAPSSDESHVHRAIEIVRNRVEKTPAKKKSSS